MKDLEFHIDAWTPATIPQERLGQYLVELAKLYGEPGSIRFKGLKKGSLEILSQVAKPAWPKVERRLFEISRNAAPKDTVETFRRIDQMLAEDNSTAVVRGLEGGNVLQFPGRTRPRVLEYGPVREAGSLEGEIVRIGGRDRTVHIALQDGDQTWSAIETNRETAREIAPLIFGPTVRFWGVGTWRRSGEASWMLERFQVTRWERVKEQSLADAVEQIRDLGGSNWHKDHDPVASLIAQRESESGGER